MLLKKIPNSWFVTAQSFEKICASVIITVRQPQNNQGQADFKIPTDRRQAYCSAACAKKAYRRQQRDYMRKRRSWGVDN